MIKLSTRSDKNLLIINNIAKRIVRTIWVSEKCLIYRKDFFLFDYYEIFWFNPSSGIDAIWRTFFSCQKRALTP